MNDSLLIYSGGMDSTVLLYDLKDLIALCLSFNYGSKHNELEFENAARNTALLDIPHLRFDLSDIIGRHFKSALLKTGGDIPKGHYEDPSMKETVVPFRNGIMLSLAVGLAESRDLKRVMYANHGGDHAIYPDCREDFLVPFSQAASNGTYAGITIFSPYIEFNKRDIGLLGHKIGVAFEDTWTCYDPFSSEGQGWIHCGKCGACTERKEALEGFDTTIYAD